ncbi:MAG: glycosyltransferase [Anaerolineae bacterium]
MNILLLTSQVPYPPHGGGALRVYGLLDGLHRAGYLPDLLSFADRSVDPCQTPLKDLCGDLGVVPPPRRRASQRLRDLVLTNHADLARRFESTDYAAALTIQLRKKPYQIVQIQSLEMATYLPLIRSVSPQSRIIYDAYNAEYELQRLIYTVDRRRLTRLPLAVYSFIQWQRLITFERQVCQKADQVIAVSSADASLLRALAPQANIQVIPNGIFAAEYLKPATHLPLGDAALLFTGTMNYRPNVDSVLWFADHILGRIRDEIPTARLFVVGNKPHARLDALRRRSDVEVTGFVQDIRPFLHSATVYVAPLRMGSGTRLKLLQAMAAGCAIVSTSVGAQGIQVQNGREMLIADDEASFAQAVIGLLRDPGRRVQLGTSATALVQNRYDWAAIAPDLVAIYKRLERAS